MPQNNKTIKVAAGVIIDTRGRVLVARRPLGKHQGGLWEFPGGKIETGESTLAALARELEEEVGIHITSSESLICIRHAYPDKNVCLDVLRVTEFSGNAWGREGQEIAWVAAEDLPKLKFPAANVAIVAAARLPRCTMITGAFDSDEEFQQRLRQGLMRQDLNHPVGMVQFRAPWLNRQDYSRLTKMAHEMCRAHNVPLLLNCSIDTFHAINSGVLYCEGLHLTSTVLASLNARPIAPELWLSAACHNLHEIKLAEALGADFISLSPVQPTRSHPGQPALGWCKFAMCTEEARLPVYALGGLVSGDLEFAIKHGAQGIAAIGAYWQTDNV